MNKLQITLGGLLTISVILTVAAASSASFVPAPVSAEITSSEILDSPVRDEFHENNSRNLSLTEIFQQSESGIVSIAVTKSSNIRMSGVGSGFVYDITGNIITNNHVVENAEKIIVTFIDGRSYNAEIVGNDEYSDLAVIKIDAKETTLHPLKIGNSDLLKVGESVTAIGNPYGLSGSMTSGIVSQIGRLLPSQDNGFLIPDVIQTDAAINPGNSGGPLLDMTGNVIGVTTAIYSNDGSFSGVGFAIPSNTINKIIPILIEKGSYKHSWIGITSLDITPDIADILGLEDAKGVMIMEVIRDGPANKAGLRGSSEIVEKDGIEYTVGGDVILTIDDQDVRKIDDIVSYLQKEKSVGDTATFKIIRDGKITMIDVLLEERPS
ncbi:MAG: PDZ domain-containing protein [Nitrosopumilus sp.]|nr:PDZ domain-containing protein [Nitrosopumilus sp.]